MIESFSTFAIVVKYYAFGCSGCLRSELSAILDSQD